MKKLFFTILFFLAFFISHSQSTAMISILLEDGKESEYLEKIKEYEYSRTSHGRIWLDSAMVGMEKDTS